MKDTREAMSPCFHICKGRGLDETIMKVVSQSRLNETSTDKGNTAQRERLAEGFSMTLFVFSLLLQLR